MHDYAWAIAQLKLYGVTVDFNKNIISHPGFTTSWHWGAHIGVDFLDCVRVMVEDMEK